MSNSNRTGEFPESNVRSRILLWLIWNMWLFFLIPAVTELFGAHPTLLRLVATLVGLALFIGVYMWTTWNNVVNLTAPSPPARRAQISVWLPIVVLTVLSLILVPGNGKDWADLFILTGAYTAGRLPTVQAALAVGVLVLLTIVDIRLTDPNWYDVAAPVTVVTVVGVVVMSMVRTVTTGLQLRAARGEIARLAVTTERLRIARDLHDLLGHNLSLITLKSELAGRLVKVSPERAAVEIGDIENVARTTLQQVREAVAAYRQPTLSGELHAAQEILAAAGIAYRFEGDESMVGTLPTAIEAVLSWTVREGVTNVIRHSRAHQCTIRVTRDKHNVSVEIADDGVGVPPVSDALQPGAEFSGSTGNGGHGIRGLTERVEALGGRCEVWTRVGGGFRLAVSVPLAQGNLDTGTSGNSAASPAQRVPTAPLERTKSSGERSK